MQQNVFEKVLIKPAPSLDPICIILPDNLKVKEKKTKSSIGDPELTCNVDPVSPRSFVNQGSIKICKYLEDGDAMATDSVTNVGGPSGGDFTLMPIFFGSLWSEALPGMSQVTDAMNRIVNSPYLSQMDQYGLTSLRMRQPIQVLNDPTMPLHSNDDAGNMVENMIDAGYFPEPDEPGGRILYMVFFPPGTTVNPAVCGKHTTAYNTIFDLDYAWVAYVEYGNQGPFSTDNLSKVFSHELVEMISDLEPDGDHDEGWRMNRNFSGDDNEIGDACSHSVDFVEGKLVSAYWSERHKACIIPKRQRGASIDYTERSLNVADGPSGTATVNGNCHHGEYSWKVTYNTFERVLNATAYGFIDPVFAWSLPEMYNRSSLLPDGFDGQTWVQEDIWFDDVNGTSISNGVLPIYVQITGNQLKVINIDPAIGNFNLTIQVSVTERDSVPVAPDTATANYSDFFAGRFFAFDQRYQTDTVACYIKYHREWKNTEWPKIPPRVGPDDRRGAWVNKLPQTFSGQRRTFVVEAATRAASLEKIAPDLAGQIRKIAMQLGGVPSGLLLSSHLAREKT